MVGKEYAMSLTYLLWVILVIVLIAWLLGFAFSVGGSLIHLLLVVALIVLIYNLLFAGRTVA